MGTKISNMHHKFHYIIVFAFLFAVASCNTESKQGQKTTVKKATPKIQVPEFNADSAYAYVEAQVNFGPRVPNTPEHDACASYLENKMKSFGASVIVQKAKVKAYDDSFLRMSNIIASFQPEKKNRVMLFAHWDTRPVADYCEDPARRDDPILGANDGASGVGVLMEIGRQLGMSPSNVGVDIIFFDAEDYGTPDHLDLPRKEDSWCLGSQYWSSNMHQMGYYPRYGILLDMVGAKGAMFYKEQVSMGYAPGIVNKVWNIAHELGYASVFVNDRGGMITDDHVYVNAVAGIPAINIIQHDPETATNFGAYWHTHDDNLDVIDKTTLKMVGHTVITTVYRE